jgi:hypothetical protein
MAAKRKLRQVQRSQLNQSKSRKKYSSSFQSPFRKGGPPTHDYRRKKPPKIPALRFLFLPVKPLIIADAFQLLVCSNGASNIAT